MDTSVWADTKVQVSPNFQVLVPLRLTKIQLLLVLHALIPDTIQLLLIFHALVPGSDHGG